MHSSSARSARMEPIAIIGLASFFPQAHDVTTYWDNILRERDSITDVPPSRWKLEDYYDPDPTVPDKTYSRRGGFLPDLDFDPLEFGLPPNILEVTDVSQLLALVAARQAFDDAGYGEGCGYDFGRTGVVLGIGGGQKLMTPLIARLQYPVWERALRSCGLGDEVINEAVEKIKLAYIRWEENSFPGMLGNVIAGRIANRFDLGGINCVTDAACASSLSALQMAISELSAHRCDMMLTGGVDTDNSPFMYLCFSKTPAFSRSNMVRPFDVASDGMMVGEGIGMLVLKRLSDAERDGDRIYALIRGIGSSSDGRYRSIYAPRVDGQVRALRRAYELAEVDPATVGLIEAHGTGTVAGDLCEVTALREVFGSANAGQEQIALGSVKSQIGHTKAAAGAAGMIKAALALHHKVLPPTINVTQPNPKFGLDGSPLYVNTRPRPWLRRPDDAPRRAGVSAFGFGGTNFHVVLEEYEAEQQQPYRIHQTAREILISAATPVELHTICTNLAEALAGSEATRIFAELAEASQTVVVPQAHARLGFVAAHPDEACEQLQRIMPLLHAQLEAERLQHPRGVWYQRAGMATEGRVVALFPGQGSQYREMGREVMLNFPPLRTLLGEANAAGGAVRPSLAEILFPSPVFTPQEEARQEAQLQQTAYAQPALGALSAGLFRLLSAAGLRPAFAAGHSFGELTALWAAGALDDAGFFRLMHARGRAMAPPDDPSFDAGTMLAVAADVTVVQNLMAQVPGVMIANLNARNQVVLAGPHAAIAQMHQLAQAAGHTSTLLPVAAAFHTPLVRHAHEPFSQAIRQTTFNPTQIPVYANTTAQPYPSQPEAMQTMLADQLLQPVYFLQQIEQIYAAGGSIFVECGPRSILTNLVKTILHDRPHVAIALNPQRKQDSDRQLREAAVQLRVLGVPMRGIDGYQRPPAPTPIGKRKGLRVRLSGASYVSDATRTAFETAVAHVTPVAVDTASTTKRPQQTDHIGSDNANGISMQTDMQMNPQSLSQNGSHEQNTLAPGELVARLLNHQRDLLQVHQQFLNYQWDYTRLLLQAPEPKTPQSQEDLAAIHAMQRETLRIHEEFLAQQANYASGLLSQIQHVSVNVPPASALRSALPPPTPALPPLGGRSVPPAPALAVAPAFAPPTAPALPHAGTPPPSPTLPPLGGESAVPAPALGSTIPPTPALPHQGGGSAVAPAFAPPVPPVLPPTAVPPPEAKKTASPAPALSPELIEGLLTVVSEKTGYPYETLELAMDMESDLGIDSIKRVDILGTMQSRFALPRLAPEELAELRTLGQVVEHLHQTVNGSLPPSPALPHQGGGSVVPHAPALTPPPTPALPHQGGGSAVAPAPAFTPPPTPALTPLGGGSAVPAPPVSPPTTVAPPPASAIGGSVVPAPTLSPELIEGLLTVVSEKTGYPYETLELAMDMESDLGIDSIKRVDILGTMQSRFALPRLAPEELAELRTLGQVVEHLHQTVNRSAVPPTPALPHQGGGSVVPHAPAVFAPAPVPTVPSAPPRLVQLPMPDLLELAPVDGWSCVVTDDGSSVPGMLAQALAERGWQPVVLRLPTAVVGTHAPLPRGIARVVLPDMSETHLNQTLHALAESYGPICGLIHLHPQATSPLTSSTLFSAIEHQLVRHIFLAAGQLKASLVAASQVSRAFFVTLTRLDGELGTSMRQPISPVGGGLFGLVKSLRQEWPTVFCRAMDVHPAYEAEQIVGLVLGEMYDPDQRLVEVGYGYQGRVTLEADLPTGDIS
nr:type I polyketide synthase [Candidatus Chloroploca sp. Khr17]